MTTVLNVGFPNGPLVDGAGNVTPPWRAFLLAMFSRTGGAVGISSGSATAQIAAETAARQSADTALSAAVSNEATARAAAIANEASIRAAADGYLGSAAADASYLITTEHNARLVAETAETAARIAADAAETAARIAGDAALVPRASLAALWMALDLGSLPAADPGFGQPWLDGIHVAVGTSGLYSLLLEDATGHWITEDATGAWDFT